MAHSASAKKSHRQSEARRLRNRATTSRMKTEIKKVLSLVEGKDLSGAEKALPAAFKYIDKAAKKHVIHRHNAANKKSGLARAIARARKSS